MRSLPFAVAPPKERRRTFMQYLRIRLPSSPVQVESPREIENPRHRPKRR